MYPSDALFLKLLGVKTGKAQGRLYKSLLYRGAVETNRHICIRCGEPIKGPEDISIDHIEPWINSDNPKEKYYDVENVGYSHKKCNRPYLTKDDVFKCLDNFKQS